MLPYPILSTEKRDHVKVTVDRKSENQKCSLHTWAIIKETKNLKAQSKKDLAAFTV